MTKRTIRFISTCAAALVALAAGVAQAQTPYTTGGGEVRAFLARSGTQVYAAAYGAGLFVSTNTGQSFARVNTLPSNMRYLTAIAGNGSYFVVAGDEGLARSTNGTTWTQTLFEPIAAVAVGNGASNTVLVAVKGLGILRSTDGGQSFGAADNSSFDSTDMTAVVFHPSNANIAYAAASPDKSGARGGVWQSVNGGATWSPYSGNLPSKYVQTLTVDTTGRVFAGTFNPIGNTGGAYSTTNGTWAESTGTFSGIVSLHTDANVAGKVWAGSSGFGLYSGTSASMNYAWPVVPEPNRFFTGINAVATLPGAASVALKAIKGAGIWRTTNNGTSWTRLTGVAFPNADRVRSMAHVGGSTAGRLAGLHAGGVWRSTDSGGTYSEAFTINGNVQADFHINNSYTSNVAYSTIWELAAHATSPNLVYAAAGGVGMFYRNDAPALFRYNGSSWGAVGNDATAGPPANGQVEPGALAVNLTPIFGVAMHPADSNQVYASSLSGSAFILRRSGGTWINEVPGGLPQVRTVVPSANGAVLLALNFNDKPNRSVDNGNTWTPVSVSQSGFEFLRFFAAAENPGSASNWIAGTNKGIFRSDDAGASWSRVSMASPFQQVAITAVGFNAGGKAFAADMAGNRYCSPNGGFTWVSAGTPLKAGVNAIRRVNNELYYLTDGAGMQREDGTC